LWLISELLKLVPHGDSVGVHCGNTNSKMIKCI